MSAQSAGILLHRLRETGPEVLLVHPGGPFWARRDLGAWSIPKGEVEPDEEPLAAARREFIEELGHEPVTTVVPVPLGEVQLRSGKRIVAFALAGDFDPATFVPHLIEISVRGRTVTIPEVDRAEWFSLDRAREKLNPGQVPLVDRLAAGLEGSGSPAA